jgi:hypothetical protein
MRWCSGDGSMTTATATRAFIFSLSVSIFFCGGFVCFIVSVLCLRFVSGDNWWKMMMLLFFGDLSRFIIDM